LSKHVLVIVQNLPVPLDRRVWLECQALRANGYDVSVICPKGPGDPDRQLIDGVHIYKYRPAPEANGLLGFAIEFAYSWMRTALLSVTVWRRHPFDVIQACNPPDTYWLLARFWRLRGVRFVFDQHDLNPELFISRFGEPEGRGKQLQFNGLLWLESMTYRTAQQVISTNESYKRIAIERGHRRPEDVTVVRSGPDTNTMRPIYPATEPPADAPQLLAYLGIMGPQDGVDTILKVMDELIHGRGRTDVRAVLMGFGDCLEDLKAEAKRLNLGDSVTFTGRVTLPTISDWLSRSSIGLCPDLRTPLNDVSTMNKTMEYMAYALPSVAFDLVETRVSGGESVVYVPSGDIGAFTDAVVRLLDDPELRADLGVRARHRVVDQLDWRPQSRAYVGVYNRLFGLPELVAEEPAAWPTAVELGGVTRQYVDIADEDELRRFAATRRARPAQSEQQAPAISP